MINSIDEIISSIRKGEMVIIMDDENRENEGDLVMASQFIKASDINFMASKGRGLICLTLTESKCKDLDLPLLKQSGSESSKETNFTVSIDAIKGVTTGISASDRARTIRAAVKKVLNQKILLSQVTSFQLWLKTVVSSPELDTQKQDVILQN